MLFKGLGGGTCFPECQSGSMSKLLKSKRQSTVKYRKATSIGGGVLHSWIQLRHTLDFWCNSRGCAKTRTVQMRGADNNHYCNPPTEIIFFFFL